MLQIKIPLNFIIRNSELAVGIPVGKGWQSWECSPGEEKDPGESCGYLKGIFPDISRQQNKSKWKQGEFSRAGREDVQLRNPRWLLPAGDSGAALT